MSSDFDPRFDPAFQRGFNAASAKPASEPGVGGPEGVASPVAEPAVVRPVESPSAGAREADARGNPWLRALWVMAAAFVVIGIAGQWIAQQLFAGGASSGSVVTAYVWPSILQALSPWFLVAGLISAIAAVTIKAARWAPGA
jgi:hypothetical protein